MVDLKERFHALDQVPAPELGRVIELRARHLVAVPGALRADLHADVNDRRGITARQLLAAAAILLLGLGLAIIAQFARSEFPAKHKTPPPPPPGQLEPYRGIWPQLTIEDAQYAQQQADAGDAAYAWQVDAGQDTHVPQRYLQERLGWARAAYVGTEYDPLNHAGQDYEAKAVFFHFVECGASGINPLYSAAAGQLGAIARSASPTSTAAGSGPIDPDGPTCAPTIDQTHYHTVRVRVVQPVKHGRTGIWVVTGVEEVSPFVQVAPTSKSDVQRLMEAYLNARLAGNGADDYIRNLDKDPAFHLYATSAGSRFTRYQVTFLDGPRWPDGWYQLTVTLTAQDGSTVRESNYQVDASAVRTGIFRASYLHLETTAR
jgi:hypothetical protein